VKSWGTVVFPLLERFIRGRCFTWILRLESEILSPKRTATQPAVRRVPWRRLFCTRHTARASDHSRALKGWTPR
jgi:hypothetical protein